MRVVKKCAKCDKPSRSLGLCMHHYTIQRYPDVRKRKIIQAVEWQKKNKNKRRATSKKYADKNREKVRAASNLSARKNPDVKSISVQNRRAKIRAIGGTLSKGITHKLLALQRGSCAGCGKKFVGRKYHRDHVVALANGGQNIDANIQLLCPLCKDVYCNWKPAPI